MEWIFQLPWYINYQYLAGVHWAERSMYVDTNEDDWQIAGLSLASFKTKDVNESYSQELMNMVMQKYQAAEVGTFNPNLPLPM